MKLPKDLLSQCRHCGTLFPEGHDLCPTCRTLRVLPTLLSPVYGAEPTTDIAIPEASNHVVTTMAPVPNLTARTDIARVLARDAGPLPAAAQFGPGGTEPPQLASSVVGQVFAGFIITGVLEEGGMGVVYDAHHTLLGTLGVVKMLHRSLKDDRLANQRMLTEGQVLSAMVHRNVVRVFGFGNAPDGRPWLLMEKLTGETLARRLRGGRIPIVEALDLMHQMATGLEAIHEIAVIHRDIKPSNIFITLEPDGERIIKFIDFGIAKPESGRAAVRTEAGRFVGTVHYGAPELFAGEQYSPASDVYSLGCVFYELLAGRMVVTPTARKGDLAELMHQHQRVQPPRLSQLGANVPAAIDTLVHRMLSKVAQERPSAQEVRAQLAPHPRSFPVLQHPRPASGPAPAPPRWRRLLPWMASLGALAAALAGLAWRLTH